MDYVWNYIKERFIPDGFAFTMDAFCREYDAEDDLTKVDIAFEIFGKSEREFLEVENAITSSEMSGEDAYLALKRAKMKQRLTSHFFAISLYHIVEKVLKAKLASVDCNAWTESLNFEALKKRLKEHGYDIQNFSNYDSINKLRMVANAAKHDLETDKQLDAIHTSFKFREELPYLGSFFHDNNIIPACWAFIRELYAATASQKC